MVIDDEKPASGRRRAGSRSAASELLRIVAFEDRPDYAGIARELSMPIGSIGPTRGRCLDKLKTLLSSEGEWP